MTTTITNHEKGADEVRTAETTYEATYAPKFDIWEGENDLRLFGDLPGVAPEDLDIQYENRELTIHGKVRPRCESHKALATEYGLGDFHRVFTVGESIDADKISAQMSGGVLVVVLPKIERAKPRRIEVSTSGIAN